MLNRIRALLGLAVILALAAGLFLVCRHSAERLGWPDWTAIALSLPLPLALLCGLPASILGTSRRRGAHASRFSSAHALYEREEQARYWRAGLAFLDRSGPQSESIPWYLSFNPDGGNGGVVESTALHTLPGNNEATGFTWRFSRHAVWLDLNREALGEDGNRWRAFLRQLAKHHSKFPLGGVVYTLDARRLLTMGEQVLRREAGKLRACLDDAERELEARQPVYLLVDRIDALYGMRSLAELVTAEQLAAPLGMLGRNADCKPAEFAAEALDRAAHTLMASASTRASAAAFQADAELRRLREPLAYFCSQAFLENPYQTVAHLRGLFFGSTGPAGKTLPSLLQGIPAFHPVDEPAGSGKSWFWQQLLDQILPGDALPPRQAAERQAARSRRAGLAALYAGCLALCCATTCTFVETTQVLREAESMTAPPMGETDPAAVLSSLDRIGKRNAAWRLPRFGMEEANLVEAALRQRYAEIRSPSLTETSSTMAQAEPANAVAPEMPKPEAILAMAPAQPAMPAKNAVRLPGDDEQARPSETKPCMIQEPAPAPSTALSSDSGMLRRLAEWADNQPGLEPIDVGTVWYPLVLPASDAAKRVIRPAWTAAGYARVAELLETIQRQSGADYEAEKQQYLAAYRLAALTAWQHAIRETWREYRDRISPEEAPALMRQLAEADGPAFRVVKLLSKHVIPMFSTDGENPEFVWLKRYAELLHATPATSTPSIGANTVSAVFDALSLSDFSFGPEKNDDAAAAESGRAGNDWRTLRQSLKSIATRCESKEHCLELLRLGFGGGQTTPVQYDGDLLGDAMLAALRLDAYLNRDASVSAWPDITPLAVYQYAQFLAASCGATLLDRIWRDDAYPEYQLSPGTRKERIEAFNSATGPLAKYLTGAAKGLWRYEHDRMHNRTWDDQPFFFSREFLDYCTWAVNRSREPRPEKMTLPLEIDRLSVNTEAAEKPTGMQLRWLEHGREQLLAFRNYHMQGAFEWQLDGNVRLELTVSFPSLTLSRQFNGAKEILEFLQRLDNGTAELAGNCFPSDREALQRLGVDRLVLKMTAGNLDLFRRIAYDTLKEPPASVIARPPCRPVPDITPALFTDEPGFGNRNAFLRVPFGGRENLSGERFFSPPRHSFFPKTYSPAITQPGTLSKL